MLVKNSYVELYGVCERSPIRLAIDSCRKTYLKVAEAACVMYQKTSVTPKGYVSPEDQKKMLYSFFAFFSDMMRKNPVNCEQCASKVSILNANYCFLKFKRDECALEFGNKMKTCDRNRKSMEKKCKVRAGDACTATCSALFKDQFMRTHYKKKLPKKYPLTSES